MSDWIKHDGKGCPVDYDEWVLVYFERTERFIANRARYLSWRDFGDRREIVTAYQVITPYKPDAATVAPPATPLKKS